jgi:hypothetical protein
MNQWERDYAGLLEARVLLGELVAFRYEHVKLRLADNTFYIVDFLVIAADGLIEFHEVKGGHWQEDARLKIKVAAEQNPWFTFIAASRRRRKDPWKYEAFG